MQGRNGGHIKYAPYEEYSRFLTRYGRARAAEIVRFRRAHLDELLGLAKHLGDSEAREVQTFDVYYDSEGFTKARSQLETYLADFPHERPNWLVHGGEETRSKLGFRRATGAFGFRAGALSPYNLVTTLLSELVKEHSKFSVHPNTQVAEIQPSLIPGQSIVSTADGRKLVAKHIVHATNGYASQVGLLPGMAGKIFPVRGTMSAHPTSSPSASDSFPHKGETSWSFVYQKGFDYCIQRPYPDGRLMLGGGLLNGEDDGLRDIGASTDDADTVSVLSDAHLRGLPGTVFGDAWGSPPSGRPVQVWTGVMGWSADMLPWVGEVGSDVVATGRRLGGAREWISAGYTGEGMINAWLCGRGLARMISEQDNHGVPQPFLFSRERRAKANVVDHVDDYFGR
jgi:glycine/D-amino acid oxidase-like deaminating enzyme